MLSNPDLWNNIHNCPIENLGGVLTFDQRLTRENDWSIDFAHVTIEECKKFTYFAIVSGHPVTPSDEVDQAWHLHLTYSEHYWDEFCPNILGYKLHHGPTKGGTVEDDKFEKWYLRTKAVYEIEFGAWPSEKFWPLLDIRFNVSPHSKRINESDYWIIPKLKIAGKFKFGLLVLLMFAGLGDMAWAQEFNDSRFSFGKVMAVVIVIFLMGLS